MSNTSRYPGIIGWSTVIICAVIILLEILLSVFFPEWSVRNGNLHLASQIVFAGAICGIIVAGIFLTNALQGIKWAIAVIAVLITLVSSYLTVYPIDTTTEPYDKSILKQFPNGSKLVAREYKNAKTTREIRDTVLVKDFFIFRKILN